MHHFRPAVLIHIVAEIVVAGFLSFLEPVVQIALDPVRRDGETAPLLEDDPVQFELCKRVLQILPQI